MPHERAIFLVKCDFSYSCAAADKISTDFKARAVSLRQLSYLFFIGLLFCDYSGIAASHKRERLGIIGGVFYVATCSAERN